MPLYNAFVSQKSKRTEAAPCAYQGYHWGSIIKVSKLYGFRICIEVSQMSRQRVPYFERPRAIYVEKSSHYTL